MRAPLKWYVVETPEVCKYGRAFENEELQFRDELVETIKEAGKIDLLLTSGTLQCVDDPYHFLKMIANSGADFILFSRLGLTLGETDVIAHHKSMLSSKGIGRLPEGFVDKEVEYPFSFIRKDKFDAIIEPNYGRKIEWNDPSGIFPVGEAPIIGIGILFQLNA